MTIRTVFRRSPFPKLDGIEGCHETPPRTPKDLEALEELLGYTFRSKNKLITALTHSSMKTDRDPSNERLEFFGDAVLGLVVTEYLFKNHPDLDEGDMTTIKSVVVSSDSLLKVAKAIRLRGFLSVGRGIVKRRSIPASLMADAVEAIIGAIYLDSGYRAAKTFVLAHVEPMVDKVLRRRARTSFKSRLQAYAQKKFGATPHYELITEEGPDHRKVFELAAVVCDRKFPPGKGKTKKIASQQAARIALKYLQDEYGKQPPSTH